MPTARNVLIVDDEPVVCLSAQHVLSGQGYKVETNTDPVEGLRLATQRDYSAVLVDIKMDKLNGLDLLAELRTRKPNLPVLVITGYPSEENVRRARELKASGLLEKPFTPQALTDSLRNLWAHEVPSEDPAPAKVLPLVCRPDPAACFFSDESWFRSQADGTVKTGAIVAGPHAELESSVTLPSEGDFVYRGLPLAVVAHGSNHRITVTSPVTGYVRSVNRDLEESPELLWSAGPERNWIARIEPTRLGRDLQAAGTRDVRIVSSNPVLVRELGERLRRFGCEVTSVTSQRDLDGAASLNFLDADSLGEEGPVVAARFARDPARKVVVIGKGTAHETEYRQAGVFFISAAPMDGRELNDLLSAAFRRTVPRLNRVNESGLIPDLLRSITIRNRSGERVTLLADGSTLSRRSGVGRSLTDLLLHNDFPVETMRAHHVGPITAAALEAASSCADRVVILRFENRGAIPGTIRIRNEAAAGKPVTSVNVQGDPRGARESSFEAGIEQALAQNLLEILA